MKIRIDEFLKAGNLMNATKDKPVFATIKAVKLVKGEDLPFESRSDRYELSLEMEEDSEQWKFLANKTSLRALMTEFGDNDENWVGKGIKLSVAEMLVQGKILKVVLCNPA